MKNKIFKLAFIFMAFASSLSAQVSVDPAQLAELKRDIQRFNSNRTERNANPAGKTFFYKGYLKGENGVHARMILARIAIFNTPSARVSYDKIEYPSVDQPEPFYGCETKLAFGLGTVRIEFIDELTGHKETAPLENLDLTFYHDRARTRDASCDPKDTHIFAPRETGNGVLHAQTGNIREEPAPTVSFSLQIQNHREMKSATLVRRGDVYSLEGFDLNELWTAAPPQLLTFANVRPDHVLENINYAVNLTPTSPCDVCLGAGTPQ